MTQFHQLPTHSITDVTLRVKNLTVMADFYHRVLGMQIISNETNRIVFGVDHQPLVTLQYVPGVTIKAPYRSGLYHFAILLPTRANLASFYEHITLMTSIEGASDHGVSEALYLSDPEGNGIEVYTDREPSQWPRKDAQLVMVTLPLMTRSLLSTDHTPWQGMPIGTVLGHLHLHVDFFDKMEHFFTSILGYEVQQRYGPSAVFLGDAGYHHHLGLNTWNGVGAKRIDATMTGLIGYGVASTIDGLEQIKKALTASNIPFTATDTSIITKDPLGHTVTIK